MQNALSIVVFGAVAVSLVMSLVFLVSKNSAYDEIGRDGLGEEGDPFAQSLTGRSTSAETLRRSPELQRSESELEIRQMLQARSERRVRRGEPALDIDAEVAALMASGASVAPAQDEGIAEEVLQLVIARNERRKRQGLEPLDVEAEVQRTLTELNP